MTFCVLCIGEGLFRDQQFTSHVRSESTGNAAVIPSQERGTRAGNVNYDRRQSVIGTLDSRRLPPVQRRGVRTTPAVLVLVQRAVESEDLEGA
jgi:hypothetical protein